MKSISLIDRLAFAVTLLMLAGAAGVALYGPTTPVPLHFDLSGQADRYGSRYELSLILAGLSVLNVIVALMTGHQAKAATDPVRQKALRSGQLLSVVIMSGTALMIGWVSLGPKAASGTHSLTITAAFLCAICLMVGAVLGKVGPNPFIGVKTPWAYKSRLAWDKSNRLAGRLMFWLGLGGLIALTFAPAPVVTTVVVAGMIGASIWSVYESWRVWRTDPEAQSF